MLLARLLPTPKGAVFFDDVDLCDLPLGFVRESVGYAQQDAFLFSTTVTGNVGFALPETDSEASRALIRAAAKDAQVYEEAMALPEQFDTVVGERGVQLSGGQKQRISIARVFLKNPPILILDEATSSLDNESEKLVQQSLERLAKGRTTLTIAHRLTTIRNADTILVLTKNGIAEQGTHAALLAQKGIYAGLYEMYAEKV